MLASLRSRLLLIVFLASLPGLAFIVLAAVDERQTAQQVARQDLLQKVHAIAEHQGRIIAEARLTLTLLAEIPPVRQSSAEGAAILSNFLKEHPAYVNLGVADPQGNILCSAIPSDQPVNISDRYYFLQAIHSHSLAIGSYQIGHHSKKPSLGMGYPFLNAKGQVAGVIFAGLDLKWFQNLTDTLNLLAEANVTLIDSNGTVLARVPDPERFVGRRRAGQGIVKTVLRKTEGTAEDRGLDGQKKLYAFAPLAPPYGAGYVYAGIPTRVIFAPANQHLVMHLLWLGLVIALALVVTWILSSRLILDRLHRLTQATEKLARGDLGARTGISYGRGELDLLARRFDRMGEDLQRRECLLKTINQILAAATRAEHVREFLQAAVADIARFTNCAAVGIRILRPDGSIPHEAFQGFSEDFFTVESTLCLKEQGMCRKVISGQTDPGLPYCTEGGSFFVNASSRFLADFSPEERGPTRSACNKAGYESVALIPLRLGARILGLIHLADHREAMVPAALVEDLETLATRLAAALEGIWVKENIRTLSHELIRLQEKERQHLARELHDSLAQDLAALKMELTALGKVIPPEVHDSSRFSSIADRLQEILGAVRDLAHDLRPPLLDELGLVKALEAYCQDFTRRTGVPVDFLVAGVDGARPDADTAVTLFRLVQEGLSNIRKHARATQVTVRLVASHPYLILRLEDDGRGFEVEERQVAAASERRLGLVGMQERVALLDGVMRIESQPEQGTRIIVEIPWQGAEHDGGEDHPHRG